MPRTPCRYETPDDLIWIASIGLADPFTFVEGQKADEGLAGWIVANRETLYVENVTESELLLFSDLVAAQVGLLLDESIEFNIAATDRLAELILWMSLENLLTTNCEWSSGVRDGPRS